MSRAERDLRPTSGWRMWIPEWPQRPWSNVIRNWLVLVGALVLGRFLGGTLRRPIGEIASGAFISTSDLVGLTLGMMFWRKWEGETDWAAAFGIALLRDCYSMAP